MVVSPLFFINELIDIGPG